MKPSIKPSQENASSIAKRRDFPELNYNEDPEPTRPVPLHEQPRQVRIDHEMAIVRAEHERIAKAIEVFWGDQKCVEYMQQLVFDGGDNVGRTRTGFKREVVAALMTLLSLHQIRKKA